MIRVMLHTYKNGASALLLLLLLTGENVGLKVGVGHITINDVGAPLVRPIAPFTAYREALRNRLLTTERKCQN
uniref:Putative secreted protein n=1 Tax=Anopheles darlingi TaxID=43151 RepID=A0A2M4DHA4_ANODA